MNIILLEPQQESSSGLYRLNERQAQHLQKVIKASPGDTFRVGLLDGLIGEGEYVLQEEACIRITRLTEAPPSALPLTVILALPRPNMLKRTLLNMTAMGVKQIVILNSAKVEKSYWQSPVLAPESIRNMLIEGLEQARDTCLPTVQMMPRFRPYVEDILPSISTGKRCLIAHPYQAEPCPVALTQEAILAIGPEGGWNEFEVSKWSEAGFESVHLGERILKVETAVPVLLSRLYPAGL